MSHLAEDDLVLLYYGESPAAAAAEAHLAACGACRAEWDALRAALDAVTDETAAASSRERTPADIDATWLALRPRLQATRHARSVRRFLLAPLAAAAALVVAFLAGRHWSVPSPPPAAAADERVRERVLLVAVGDHLERSQMLLVELAAAPRGRAADIGIEQGWAQELVGANRLYRQAALRAGEPAVADVLDELERLLVEVASAPETLQPEQLARLQERIEARGLLFKVRVLGSRMREQQKRRPDREPGAPPRGAVS
jgi:hypothetical protein